MPRSLSAKLTRDQMTELAAYAIQVIRDRIARSQNASDGAAAAYRDNHKIYVPNTGGGRTKTSFGGREVLTPKDRQKLRKLAKKLGAAGISIRQLSNSTVFENYSSYKQALGKSGNRDLELSGRMLGSITPVEVSEDAAQIGFSRDEEEAKMRGNERWENMWGFSPKDKDAILDRAEEIAINNWRGNLDVGF